MQPAEGDVTSLLAEFASDKEQALPHLIPRVYSELRKLAAAYMRCERPDHTLQPTALVHETYIRLLDQRCLTWQNKAHFYGIAARIMRRVLVDHARGRLREKRGSGAVVESLDDATIVALESPQGLVRLDEALNRLATLDPRQSKIVELRFFAGLTVEETAEVLEVSPKTVKRDWSMAKAWLHGELKT